MAAILLAFFAWAIATGEIYAWLKLAGINIGVTS